MGRRARDRAMTAAYWLREQAAEMDRADERLTRDIEDAEKRIVDLRRQRDEVRLSRVDALAAANALDNIGFRVDQDAFGVVTVHVDQGGRT